MKLFLDVIVTPGEVFLYEFGWVIPAVLVVLAAAIVTAIVVRRKKKKGGDK